MEQLKEFKTIFEIKNGCKASINDDMLVVEDTHGMISISLKPYKSQFDDFTIDRKDAIALGGATSLMQLVAVATAVEYDMNLDNIIKGIQETTIALPMLYGFIKEVINHGEL